MSRVFHFPGMQVSQLLKLPASTGEATSPDVPKARWSDTVCEVTSRASIAMAIRTRAAVTKSAYIAVLATESSNMVLTLQVVASAILPRTFVANVNYVRVGGSISSDGGIQGTLFLATVMPTTEPTT